MWGILSYHFNTNRAHCRTVKYTAQADIERVVREETQSRFSAAESLPFCQGLLGEELGYISDTATAAAILNGTYEIPDSVSNATALLIDEIGKLA